MEEEAPGCEDVIGDNMAPQDNGDRTTWEQQGRLILCLPLLLWKSLVEGFAWHLPDSICHSARSTDISTASNVWHFIYFQTSHEHILPG